MAFLPEFFHYSKSERKGIVVLIFSILILFISAKLTKSFFHKKEIPNIELVQTPQNQSLENSDLEMNPIYFQFNPNSISLDSLRLLGISIKTAQTIINFRNKGGRFYKKEDLKKIYNLDQPTYDLLAPYIVIPKNNSAIVYKQKHTKKIKPVDRFPFDPNTANKDKLLALGIPGKVANTLINFRKKGGQFYKKEDLLTIYGFHEDLYVSLEPFINIKEPLDQKVYKQKNSTAPPLPAKIDINTASVEDWKTLKGIGPTYAGRIVKFRNKLGGFASIDQIASTYGIPDSTFQAIKPFLESSPVFRKIDINKVELAELKTHPLITWKQANVLINYRNNHGPFENQQQLYEIRAIPQNVIRQIVPYLKFEVEEHREFNKK